MLKKIAIIGTNGIPSKYGGFETLVEYLAEYLSEKFEITVFCSKNNNSNKFNFYKGCKLKYINLKANGWQSIPYDIISLIKVHKKYDKILILGASGCIIMPLFKKYREKIIFNFGGLDWQRSKWSYFTRKYLKYSELLGIKNSAQLIADNIGIQEYIQGEYKRNSNFIPYGGDHVYKVIPNEIDKGKYLFLKGDYAFTVARIQRDNNIDMLLEAFNEDSPFPFVIVGNWGNCSYGIATKRKYINYPNIILVDAIYDQRELNLLRSNCRVYIHGHSAGGTNPALVEAMNLSLPIFAYDCIFNKYTTSFKALYFVTSDELSIKLRTVSNNDLKKIGEEMYSIAKKYYQWKIVAKKYSEVFETN